MSSIICICRRPLVLSSLSISSYNLKLLFSKKIHSDNDAPEVDILGRFGKFWEILGHFWTLLDNLEDFTAS